MDTRDRFFHITEWFTKNMEKPETELHYDSPFHLLIAVILSAQCTDKRVNMVTPALFAAFPTPQAMAAASLEELEGYIKTCGFHHSKAKDIIACAQKLVHEFDGQVPRDMDALLTLPMELVDYFILNELEGAALSGETEPEKIIEGLL